MPCQKLTAAQRARMRNNRLACLARKRKKQTQRAAVKAQSKDKCIPACSVDLIGELCVPPSQVEAVQKTMRYMDELECKENHRSVIAAVTPQLRASRVQPHTPAPHTRLQRIQRKRQKRKFTANERARMRNNRLACLARKRKKQTQRAAVKAQSKDQCIPACSVDLIGELCVPPSQVEVVTQTMCYLDELESKDVLRVSQVQPRTRAPQLGVGVRATFLGLKREHALRRLLLKRLYRKRK